MEWNFKKWQRKQVKNQDQTVEHWLLHLEFSEVSSFWVFSQLVGKGSPNPNIPSLARTILLPADLRPRISLQAHNTHVKSQKDVRGCTSRTDRHRAISTRRPWLGNHSETHNQTTFMTLPVSVGGGNCVSGCVQVVMVVPERGTLPCGATRDDWKTMNTHLNRAHQLANQGPKGMMWGWPQIEVLDHDLHSLWVCWGLPLMSKLLNKLSDDMFEETHEISLCCIHFLSPTDHVTPLWFPPQGGRKASPKTS